MKILCVEDDEGNVYVIRHRLERRGFSIVVAANGEEGVKAAATERPDLILMDLRMPVLDGWEATRRIKANAATRHIPIIALTADAMRGDRERAMAAGCDDFDTKPIELSRLLGKIHGLLGKSTIS